MAENETESLKTTWDEIRIASLQKMFLIADDKIVNDSSTKSYLSSMPAAYNAAVRLISTRYRYIVKYFDVQSDGSNAEILVDLQNVVDDLFQLRKNDIYFTDESGKRYEYRAADSYGSDVLILDGSVIGTYRVYYNAYPMKVSSQTEGSAELDIDPDVATIIPLYIAGELYKDDDNSIATVYRNQFESECARLQLERYGVSGVGGIKNTTGWW